MTDTLFYDARCPLCRREVGMLKRATGPSLAFQDIHTVTITGRGDVTLAFTAVLWRSRGQVLAQI